QKMAFAVVLMICLIRCVSAGFFYSESATCGTVHCPRANWARFYGCSQEGECDFLLQPWLFMLVSFVVVSLLCSLLCSLLRCICCGCCRDRRY
uniref:Uncharacterized protein n=1 Tax=Parascaris univalens TaxID=6257 RepID=A0A915B8G2_PARUN